MSITCNPQFLSQSVETFDIDGSGNNTVSYKEFDRKTPRYDSTTTPAVTKGSSGTVTMSGGAATLDLTAIDDIIGGSTVTFSGLKVVYALFKNPSANAITIAPGVSNGYNLQGGESIVVYPSGTVAFDFADGLSDVSGSAKNLDISGTGTQTLNFTLVAG